MRRTPGPSLTVAALLAVLIIPAPVRAWDAQGHRTITALAVDALPDDIAAWLQAPEVAARIADEAVVPDRWRAIRSPALVHTNGPDHYIDLEELAPLKLELRTLTPLRYEYVRAVALARVNTPVTPPPTAGSDTAKIADWPGFVPWAICENHAKVVAAFKAVRILERLRDEARAHATPPPDAAHASAEAGPATRPDTGSSSNVRARETSPELALREMQLAMAREDLLHHMGVLGHFVGDAAQPLHTTIHHHGWVGDNPNGYTTDRGIHAYIDGKIVDLHHLDFAALHDAVAARPRIAIADALNPWPEIVDYVQRSFAQVEPLYQLKKSGELESAAGKAFIAERMSDAAAFLEGLYEAAWLASEPTEDDVRAFLRYDKINEDQLAPARASEPAPAPAGSPPAPAPAFR